MKDYGYRLPLSMVSGYNNRLVFYYDNNGVMQTTPAVFVTTANITLFSGYGFCLN